MCYIIQHDKTNCNRGRGIYILITTKRICLYDRINIQQILWKYFTNHLVTVETHILAILVTNFIISELDL